MMVLTMGEKKHYGVDGCLCVWYYFLTLLLLPPPLLSLSLSTGTNETYPVVGVEDGVVPLLGLHVDDEEVQVDQGGMVK
jgi:hypothetical protein